jgi:hypothetical protein
LIPIKEQALVRGAIKDDRQAGEALQKGGGTRLIEALTALGGRSSLNTAQA